MNCKFLMIRLILAKLNQNYIMNIKGKLIEIYEAKQITDSFKKREFVVDAIDGFKIGDFIDVQFDLRGKPWTNKQGEKTYFTSLSAWKIQSAGDSQNNISQDEAPPESSPDEEYPF